MVNKRHASLAPAALLFCALVAPSARGSEIKIAVAGPMTGSSAAFGAQMRDGAAAAVEVLNASGQLPDNAKTILSVADDACDPRQAVAVANKLTTERILLVVGHFCSSSSIPASDIYAKLASSRCSSTPQLTEHGLETVFRICGPTTNREPLPPSTFTRIIASRKSRCWTTRGLLAGGLSTWLKPGFIDWDGR
ncbi:ABC transporter substrate-binding protein [Bradyrhizobium daqingense]|uniref:ABC transporter substrate-binding protein n=1 Tax=Bradyrhizobium daqingense TaxID=993502 RepID=UPI00384AD4E8